MCPSTHTAPDRVVRCGLFALTWLLASAVVTDRPALAREVVARYADMTQAERLLLFAMTQFGVREEISEPEDNLRP